MRVMGCDWHLQVCCLCAHFFKMFGAICVVFWVMFVKYFDGFAQVGFG